MYPQVLIQSLPLCIQHRGSGSPTCSGWICHYAKFGSNFGRFLKLGVGIDKFNFSSGTSSQSTAFHAFIANLHLIHVSSVNTIRISGNPSLALTEDGREKTSGSVKSDPRGARHGISGALFQEFVVDHDVIRGWGDRHFLYIFVRWSKGLSQDSRYPLHDMALSSTYP